MQSGFHYSCACLLQILCSSILGDLAAFVSAQLLKFPLTPCPRYEQLQTETRHSAEYVNKTKENWVSDCLHEIRWF